MSRRIVPPVLATAAGVLVVGAASSAVGAQSAAKVAIRIEGAERTLLADTTVQAPASGSITKDGAPAGKCPADSAAGVLNVATKESWNASWSSKYDDYLITEILGDTESGKSSYWEILVNNVAASTGACAIKLHAGDQLLFAAVPVTGSGYPLVIKAPRTANVGSSLEVRVDDVNGKGVAVPVAGATVSGGGVTAKTSAQGIATLTVKHSGLLTFRASANGYIRAAAVEVKAAS